MSLPSEALAGEVQPLFKIKRGLNWGETIGYRMAERNNLYVCVYLNRRWKWNSLDQISSNTFRKYQEKITKSVYKLAQNTSMDEKYCTIKISGASGTNATHINGSYYPIVDEIKENGINVYLRDSHPNLNMSNGRWLYWDSGSKWRIGNTRNMKTRHTMGWLMTSDLVGDPNADGRPWMIPSDKWKVWDGTDNSGRWNNGNITIELLTGISQISREQFKDMENKLSTIKKQVDRYKEFEKINSNLLNGCKELFNRLNTNQKHQLIKNGSIFPKIFKNTKLCAVCFSADENIKKCVHFDCPGACLKCRNAHADGGCPGTCTACGKEQKLKCPVCLEVFEAKNLNIFTCGHCTCWKCHCLSFQHKKPIKKCPTCRHKI